MEHYIESREAASLHSREAAAGALAQGGAKGGTLGRIPHPGEP